MAPPWPPRATTASSRYGSAARKKLRAVREGRACEGRVREGGSCVKVAAWRVTKGDQGRPRSTLMCMCAAATIGGWRGRPHTTGDTLVREPHSRLCACCWLYYVYGALFFQPETDSDTVHCRDTTQRWSCCLVFSPLFTLLPSINIQLIVRYNNCNCGHVGSASGAPLY